MLRKKVNRLERKPNNIFPGGFQTKCDVVGFWLRSLPRILATIYLQEQNINLEMVKNGMAWVYPQYAKKSTLLSGSRFCPTKISLWRDPNPIAPYEWRKQNKAGKHGE